ncbi:retention module-containing protein, partial [Shewanella insulae]|uniref:retention module-containing protein n=1 Tax=Shewanella insulae TaxID=2681496 RepID=UPI001EFCBA65
MGASITTQDAVVVNLVGELKVKDEQGNIREVKIGDLIHAGEQLIFSPNVKFNLEYEDGSSSTQANLIQETLNQDTTVSNDDRQAQGNEVEPLAETPVALDPEIAALQAQILADDDPTQGLPETAAGAGTTGNEGGSDFVSVGRTGDETLADAGWDTAGFPLAPDTTQEELQLTDALPEAPALSNATLIFSESALPQGSNPNSQQTTQNGTIAFSADAGVLNISIDGVPIVTDGVFNGAVTITTSFGLLTISGVDLTAGILSFSFTQTTAVDHSQGDIFNQPFSLLLTDNLGVSTTSTLTISVGDDAPNSQNDSGAVTEDDSNGASLSGNVLDNDESNADQPSSFVDWSIDSASLNAITALNQFGTLTLNSDGSYSFVLDNNLAAVQALGEQDQLSFAIGYTMSDSDGDQSSATLTIVINGTDDGVSITGLGVAANDIEQIVDESHLSDGSAPDTNALTQSGSFDFSSPDGLLTLSLGGQVLSFEDLQALAAGGTISIQTEHGILMLTGFEGDSQGGTIDYSYTLSSSADHRGGDVFDQVEINIVDLDGDNANASLDIQILNDSPDVTLSGPGQVAEQQSISGNWNLIAGADDASVQVNFEGQLYNLGQAIDTGMGTLTVFSDGTWTFTANGNLDNTSQVALSFEIQALDGDGDPASDSHLIRITDGTNPTDADNLQLIVDESQIEDIASGDLVFTAGSDDLSDFHLMAPDNINLDINGDNIDDLSWELSPDGQTLTGFIDGQAAIILSLTWSDIAAGESGNVTVSAQLLEAFPHPDGQGNNSIAVSGIVVGSDVDGDNVSGSVNVTIVDDGPIAVNDVTNQGDENSPVVYNVLDNDTQGADSATLTNAEVTNGLGSVQFNADGTVTYIPASGEEGQVVITYTITDGDGDTDQATLTINLDADSTPTVSALDATLDETGGLEEVTRDFTATYGNDTPGIITLSAAGATWNALTHTLTANNGDWQIVVNDNGTYTVTQLQTMSHPDGSDPDDAIVVNVT